MSSTRFDADPGTTWDHTRSREDHVTSREDMQTIFLHELLAPHSVQIFGTTWDHAKIKRRHSREHYDKQSISKGLPLNNTHPATAARPERAFGRCICALGFRHSAMASFDTKSPDGSKRAVAPDFPARISQAMLQLRRITNPHVDSFTATCRRPNFTVVVHVFPATWQNLHTSFPLR
jgi:hypothetical protein